jgi:tRNA (guanine-N7-)-methyltransferase
VSFGEATAGRAGVRGVEVEIGCGNGHFLCEYASSRPDLLLVGIEIKAKRVQRAREKAEKRGLRNVVIMQCGAERTLEEIPSESIGAFHIYFPDPWPKSRHRKRRFLTMENLAAMHRCLVPGGRIWFLTDFFDYYMQAKVLFLLHEGLALVPDAAPVEASLSVYHLKFQSVERPVHLACAAKVPVIRSGG